MGGGGTPGNSWWGCVISNPNHDPISDKKNVIFHTSVHWIEIYPMDNTLQLLNNWGLASKIHTCFQTSLDQNANKKCLKTPFTFAHFSFFPNHLELKQQIHTFILWFPLKVYRPIPDQNGQSLCIPVFRPKQHKNHTLWGGTCLYDYIRE